MKFARVKRKDSQPFVIPCLIDAESKVRDLSHLLQDITPEEIYSNIPMLQALNLAELPCLGPQDQFIFLPCVPHPRQFIGIAFNSKQHAQQMNASHSDEPIFFIKTVSSICGAYDPLVYPKIGKKLDWEAELGVVIGKRGKYISKENALDHVLGYCCATDFSDRHWQCEHPGQQLVKGKSFETFAPLGPFLVTKDEIQDPNNLHVTLHINGQKRQDFFTKEYQFSVEDIIHFLSQFFPLEAGDVISMGSGPGCAKTWNNAYLQIGDRIEFEIEHLGKQHRIVIPEKE